MHIGLASPRLAALATLLGGLQLLVYPTPPRHFPVFLEISLLSLARSHLFFLFHDLLLPHVPCHQERANCSSVLRSEYLSLIFYDTPITTPTNPLCSPALGPRRRLAISPSPTATVDLAPFQVPPETLPRPTVSSPYHSAVSLATRIRLHQDVLAWQQVSISRHWSYLSQSSIVTYNSLGLPWTHLPPYNREASSLSTSALTRRVEEQHIIPWSSPRTRPDTAAIRR